MIPSKTSELVVQISIKIDKEVNITIDVDICDSIIFD